MKKLVLYYQKLALIKKLIIPPAISLLLGFLFTIVAIGQMQAIEKNIKLLQERLVPALEKSTNNIALLKNISENFTFAILTSELDMISKKKDYFLVEKNLEDIAIDIDENLKSFKRYYEVAQKEAINIINKNSVDDDGSGRLDELLYLYKKVQNNFLTVNTDIKREISLKTEFIKTATVEIIYLTVAYMLVFTIVIFFASYLIYKDFDIRFKKLSKNLIKLDFKKSTKEVFTLHQDELGRLSEDIDIAIKEFDSLEKEKREVEEMAQIDQLTNLYNRHYMKSLFDRLDSESVPFGVILLDIDYFKSINDTYGHQVGDSALVKFSKILNQSTRKNDIIARWGGEEFLIVVSNTSDAMLIDIAEKIREAIESTLFDKVGKITASFGVSSCRYDLSSKEAIELADIALYRAKEGGRNRVELYR